MISDFTAVKAEWLGKLTVILVRNTSQMLL